ncbi:hypothetical protein F4861DRAFT_548892 [Xylaria intraflava]|nr:hypothetical protein F4861DRAFT_548892 [Xylaria intraflava]
MLANLGPLGKETPGSSSGHSKSDNATSSRSGPSSKSTSKPLPPMVAEARKWATMKLALEGIEQRLIDKRKREGAACWRCGSKTHQTLACYAKKDVEGNMLPQPRVSAIGMKRDRPDDDDDENPESSKRARVDAIEVEDQPYDREPEAAENPVEETPFEFFEEQESDQDF